MTLTSGFRLGPYEVLSPLGAGGMGEVYRARDTKLDRDVAIKVLPQAVAADPDSLARFEREAKAVAALSHPNILSIFDFGTQGGVSFAVMELLEGETVRGKLDAGSVSQKQSVDYALQVAKGLSAAHEKGIVHRDLKPENLFVTKDGHLKILDFGLAKKVDPVAPGEETSAPTGSGHTEPGTVMGTVGYMSPEQVRGLPVDHRSDIFSLGVILYELLSGRKAFKQNTAADTMAAILREEPAELSGSGKSVPPALEHIVRHCLEKDRERRFQSARDIVFALEEAFSASVPTVALVEARPAARRKFFIAAAVLVVVAAAWFGWRLTRRATLDLPERKQLAVLPFRNLTGDENARLMGLGMVETVTVRLSGLPGLQVVTPTAIASSTERDSEPQRLARDLGANLFVVGTLQREGGTMRITYRIIKVPDGVQIAADSLDGPVSDLFGLQDRLAEMVAKDLQFRSVLRPAVPSGLDANEQARYLEAIGLLQRYDKRESIEQAMLLLQGVAEARPNAAIVQAALGRVYLAMFDFTRDRAWADRATAAADGARRLDPGLPEMEVTLGETLLATGRAKESIQAFGRALKTNPDDFQALLGLARANQAAGNDPAAETAFKRAIELQRSSWAGYNQLGAFYFERGRYREAAELFRSATRTRPDSYRAWSNFGGALTAACDFEGALDGFRRALALRPNSAPAVSNLGLTQLWAGHYEEAVDSLEKAAQYGAKDFRIWANLGDAYRAVQGRSADASKAYGRSVELAREALQLNPRDAHAHSFTATGLARTGHLEEAAAHIRTAVELDPKNPDVLSDAAIVTALAGRKDEALDWIRQAVAAGFCPAIVAREPSFEFLRSDPRFQSLIQTPAK